MSTDVRIIPLTAGEQDKAFSLIERGYTIRKEQRGRRTRIVVVRPDSVRISRPTYR